MPLIANDTGPAEAHMHRVHAGTLATALLISICLAGTGCTTTRTLPRPQAASDAKSTGLEPGDKVVVTLTSGDVRTFRVTAIEPDALVGENTRVPFADIEKLQRKKISALKTSGAVVGVLAVAFGLWVNHIIQSEQGAD
jgi:hypothetical protein